VGEKKKKKKRKQMGGHNRIALKAKEPEKKENRSASEASFLGKGKKGCRN